MNTCDATLTASDSFCERLMEYISDSVCEEGLFVAVIDVDGSWRSTDEAKFLEAFSTPEMIGAVTSMVADGGDPVAACIDDCGIVAGQLRCPAIHRGYVVIGLSGYSIESTVANMALAETLLNQINVIASTIENGRHPSVNLSSLAQSGSLSQSFCVN